MEHQTSDAIERKLDQDRQALGKSLSDLRGKLDPHALVDSGVKFVGDHAVPAARSAGSWIMSNPFAFALIGAGVAWLAFGGQGRKPGPKDTSPLAGTKFEAVSRWEDDGGPVLAEAVEEDEDWVTEADGLRARAREMLGRIDQAARDRLAPAAELARSRAEVLAALTQDVRAAMGRGLEGLGEQARAAAMATREAAYSARIAVAEKGTAAVRDNPLVTGGLLAVAGAALAAALPRTETERRTLGSLRDRLMDAAGRFAADEMQRAGFVARDLAETLRADLDRAQAHVAEAGATMVDQAAARAQGRPN